MKTTKYYSVNEGYNPFVNSGFFQKNFIAHFRITFILLLVLCCIGTSFGQQGNKGSKGANNEEVTLFTCAENIGNGLYLAKFGYTNPTNKTITVLPDASYIFLSDKIEDSEFDGIQKIPGIFSFEPGTHDNVLSVVFADNGHAKWTVAFGGSSDQKIRATLNSPVCEGDPFIVPVIGPGNGKTEGYISPELISLAAGTAGDTPSSLIYQISPEEKVLIQIVPFDGKTQDVIDLLINTFGLQYNIQPNISDFIVNPSLIISEELAAIDVLFPINKILPPPPPDPPMPALTDYPDLIKSVQALYTPFTSGEEEDTGDAITQGDAAQKSDIVRRSFKIVNGDESIAVDGTGVNIVVFSNSFDANPPEAGQPSNEAIDVGNGDLPGIAGNGNPNGYNTPVNVIKEYPYTFGQLSDEGRAMLQIAHDIAPGANLAFRTAVLSPRDFELGVKNLIPSVNTIALDDITFPGEPAFGISNIGKAIQEFRAAGNYYFTSTGNFSDAAFQSLFVSANGVDLPDFIPDEGTVAHAFDGVDNIYQRFSVKNGETYMIVLQWKDDFASQENILGARNDFDIWVVDGEQRLLVGNNYYNDNDTETTEDGKDPVEYITFKALDDGVANFMITSANGDPGSVPFRYIIFVKNNLEVLDFFDGAPTITGHALTPEALAIGAVDFRKADAPEPQGFSSFAGTISDGSTPQVALSSYDGVNTNVTTIGQNEVDGIPVDDDDFKNFFGTSASVVHVAAAFALMESALPAWYGTNSGVDILQLFKDNADKVGNESQLGDGIVNAENTFKAIATQTGVISDFTIEFTSEEGSVISADEFELTINGDFFPEDPTVFFGEDELPIVFYDPENPSEIKVLVGPFTGNDPVTVFTNSTVPLGTDGGNSNPIFLLDDGIIAINVIAEDIDVEYGQDYDFSFTVEGLPEGVTFESLGLPDIIYTTAATPPFPKIGNYVVFPSFDLENASADQLTALQDYVVNFKSGSLSVAKKDLEIIPDPLEVTYGEAINLNLSYNYDNTNIADNTAFLSAISEAHSADFFPENTLALINGFKALVNDEQLAILNLLEDGSWISTERTLQNGFKALVNEMNLVNLNTSHFEDYSDYLTNGFKALVNDFKALVNSEDLFSGNASFGSIQNGFKALVNDSELGGESDLNDYSEVFAIVYDGDDDTPISRFYSLNLITGLDVTPLPEFHSSFAGTILDPIAYNFNITYKSGTIIVNPARLDISIGDLVIDQGEDIDTSLLDISIEGYEYDETLADVFPDGIPYLFKDANGVAYTPGATGIFFITIQNPQNYEINYERTGVLYINPGGDQLRKIRTYLDCVEENFGDPDGLNYIAHYRYINPNDETIYILEGPENLLTGPASNGGGLPFIFLPGENTFQIRFDGNTMKWELTSRDSTHKSSTTSTANSNSNRCDAGYITNEFFTNSFIIYPNPVNGLLFIDQNLPEQLTLDVFDIFGILHLSTTLDGRSGPLTHEIDMSAYNNGMYILRFSLQDDVQVYTIIKE
ncbi:S8 family peptidase [Muriicola soli]|uniref:T9SS type A sorting domain-containing protein n=1 Tax=Muriicola soli TaxID=2507538 RepID=A0A411E827_9FLAO|nr:S8 family peptidase [Muriicola soli]QBA63757.1 T9SS type A sorting domain-containing protein [Muriicola soli]